MTTVIFIFVFSLVVSLLLTPLIIRVAKRYQWMDRSSERKVHTGDIPRLGGVAIFIATFAPFITVLFYSTEVLKLLVLDEKVYALVAGALLVFSLGLWDDFKGLNPWFKFAMQAVAGGIAYFGGFHIGQVSLPFTAGLPLGWLSLPATIFWFLLVINAINLIDGLDGLAGGVSFFAAIVLVVLCITSGRYIPAMGLAALAGATLGFLRYNFNPASIFMGDGGSYFLGFMLAALSIQGSIKSQATVVMLIPVIALGLPLMDTIWATIRRFILGQGLFKPDKDHFHHRLLKRGFTHRRAVLFLYSITVMLGLGSLIMVHSSDDRAALILLLIGGGGVFIIRKLGYLEYLAVDKFFGWFSDISDEMGLKKDRRTFLGLQMTIAESKDINEFWNKVIDAGTFIKLDFIELRLMCNPDKSEPMLFSWRSENLPKGDFDKGQMLYLSVPLSGNARNIGSLALAKDLNGASLTHSVLRRVEHLRRTVEITVPKFSLGVPANGVATRTAKSASV